MLRHRLRRATRQLALAAALTAAAFLTSTLAHAQHAAHGSHSSQHGMATSKQDYSPDMDGSAHGHHMTPPPAGVMGAHLMRKGKVMMMYTPMFMHMGGSRIGTRDVTPETIVTTVPNRFDQNPMMPGVQPPTLRIAPETMSMEMHMFSLMYGITDTINVMIMSSYVEKEMRMVTFAGMAGTNRLGTSTGNTEGMGDTTVSLAFKVFEGHGNRLNASLGVSIPTGSTDEVGRMLSPMGMMMQMRSAYGMQLGTGTYDLVPSVTWTGHTGRLGWGAQYKGRIALEDESDEGYRWGNLHEVTAWLSYGLTSGLNGTARIAASTQGTIHGADPRIGGPFQGTYPEFYGGERIEAFLGLDGHIPLGHGTMARIAIEAGVPIYQNLNGPQLERDWSLVLSTGIHF